MNICTRIIGITKDRRSKDLLTRGRTLEQAFSDFWLEHEWRMRSKALQLRRYPSPIVTIEDAVTVALLERQAG